MMVANLSKLQAWRRTKRGLVTNLYHKMKARRRVEFSLEWLHEFSDCKKFDRLFLEWEAGGFAKDKKPSIDRVSSKKGYSISNVQWLTWAENRYKQTMERRRRKGAVAQLKGGKVIALYKSQREAVKLTGFGQSSISMVLTGKRKKTGGFGWAYIDASRYEMLRQELMEAS